MTTPRRRRRRRGVLILPQVFQFPLFFFLYFRLFSLSAVLVDVVAYSRGTVRREIARSPAHQIADPAWMTSMTSCCQQSRLGSHGTASACSFCRWLLASSDTIWDGTQKCDFFSVNVVREVQLGYFIIVHFDKARRADTELYQSFVRP